LIKAQLRYYRDFLEAQNYKSVYLAFLRVALCCWLLKEVAINWGSHDILYGHANFVVYKATVLNRLPGGIAFVRANYGWIIGAYLVIILLCLFGIGRWFTALVLVCMLYLVEQMTRPVTTGGDVMARLMLCYLVFADSYRHFVLFKSNRESPENQRLINLLSNLAAASIMLQLCVAYLATGIGKLSNETWQKGEAIYYALSMERYAGTRLSEEIVQYPWMMIVANYAVLAFELLFPFLVWIKACRKPLLVTGILFHLSIYVLMMIYGFQVVFIMIYGLFLPNETWLRWFNKLKRPAPRSERTGA
jgi:hypothetical protein